MAVSIPAVKSDGLSAKAMQQPESSDISAAMCFEVLLTGAEAANLLGGIHPKTLGKKAREGIIPSYEVFNRRFYRVSELDAWLKKQLSSVSQSARLEIN